MPPQHSEIDARGRLGDGPGRDGEGCGMSGGDWARLAGLSVLWGASFLFYRVLAGQVPPFSVVAGRVGFAVLGLLLILRLRGQRLAVPRAQWGRFAVLGLLNNAIPFSLFAWAETRIDGGTASIVNATTPLFVALVTGLVWRTEPLTPARLLGIGCGVAGVAVLVGPDALLGQDIWGQAACLLASVSYGFGAPYAKRIAGVAPTSMALGQLTASSLTMLPLALLIDQPWTQPLPGPAAWGALLGIALLSTSVAYIVFFDLLARNGATNLTLVTFLVPISALLLGAVVLDEAVTWNALAGMALIAAGLAAIDGRLLTQLARARPARPAPGARR